MMKSDKKIALFGCKTTSVFLADFLSRHVKLDLIITIGPDLAQKNDVADYHDLNECAKANNITCYTAKSYDLKNAEDNAYIASYGIDAAFVLGWQRLIPSAILDKISIGAFGMHGSSLNLPFGRGRSPMNWSLIEGRSVFYTNLFKYDSGVDSGDIVDTFKFSINNRDTAETMHFKNLLAMKYLIQRNITGILQHTFTLTRQPDIIPTYYPKRTPADGLIDWNDDIQKVERFIRAVTRPFAGAFTFAEGKKVTIYDSQIFDIVDFGYEHIAAGTIVEMLTAEKLLIKGYGGLLLINKYESDLELKKGMLLSNNGNSIKVFPVNKYGMYDCHKT